MKSLQGGEAGSSLAGEMKAEAGFCLRPPPPYEEWIGSLFPLVVGKPALFRGASGMQSAKADS
jgi:hypothetical protein